MLKSLKLDGIGPVQNLHAEFGERLNVLTGDNGLGKSFLLDVCFWTLTGTWPGARTALPDPDSKTNTPRITFEVTGKTKSPLSKTASFDFHSQTWDRPPGRPTMPGLVVYASVDGGFSVWDPARNYYRVPSSGRKGDFEQPRAYQFSSETLASGLLDEQRTLCSGLIADWVRWFYGRSTHGSDSPFAHLETVVTALSHPDEPMSCATPVRVFTDDSREFPALRTPYGVVPFPHWSAGVRRMIS
ncbi:MAG: ATP-binding protein, partial [Planctomycetota bacterium]|nr:ATP-binding protein [Planctomycetota bacterium]